MFVARNLPRTVRILVTVAGMAMELQQSSTGIHSPTVTRIECVRGADIGQSNAADAPFWIVCMTGRFVNLRTPPGTPAQVMRSGFYVVDDATGAVVGFGGSGSPEDGASQPPSHLEKGR
jgi:hypothetical protein